MVRPLTAAAVAAAALAMCGLSVAAESVPGTVRAHRTVSGQFAVTAISATINHPKAIYLRLVGHVSAGSVTIACSKSLAISSNHYDHNRAGVYAVPIKPAHADSCQVVGSIGGSGRVTIEIRAS